MNRPIAVLISDVHYSLVTLKLADAVMRQAIDRANELKVPLIVAGDLHDTKANLRGECVNAMIETFKRTNQKSYVLIGNHDKINEKSNEHSLNFLQDYCSLVTDLTYLKLANHELYLLPYQHNVETLKFRLSRCPTNSTIIMHQGLKTAAKGKKINSGHYFQDPTALFSDDVAGLRIISGHYHARQTIALPGGGKWDFIGNPYTLNYGEVNDPEKGFHILKSKGELEFVPTNQRRHVVLHSDCSLQFDKNYGVQDLLWVKIQGTHEELAHITRVKVAAQIGREHFKLDLIPIVVEEKSLVTTNDVLLDQVIDGLSTSAEQKSRLKQLWRGLNEP